MRPTNRMIFRLLLISEDPNLIASIHALEHRPLVRSRSGSGFNLPDRSVEVTFVSSLAGAEAALETNRPFEIVVIDRECSSLRDQSVVEALWTVAPQVCLIDCDSTGADSPETCADNPAARSHGLPLHRPMVSHRGRRFRLPRSLENDQLAQLVDTLLDRAAFRQRCLAMESELGRVGRRLDDLEEQNQTLSNQVSRLRLQQKDHYRRAANGNRGLRSGVESAVADRRNSGPAVRRVSFACETVEHVATAPRRARNSILRSTTPQGHDASDETLLSGRVLVVDDVPGNRRLAAFLLEHTGATVVQADGGQAMLDQFSAAMQSGKLFHAVVLQMGMEAMDGYECARRLRMRGFDGPIIAAIACSLPLDRQLCINAGCDEFVTMPLDRNQFIRTMRRMLKSTPATV